MPPNFELFQKGCLSKRKARPTEKSVYQGRSVHKLQSVS